MHKYIKTEQKLVLEIRFEQNAKHTKNQNILDSMKIFTTWNNYSPTASNIPDRALVINTKQQKKHTITVLLVYKQNKITHLNEKQPKRWLTAYEHQISQNTRENTASVN